MIGNKPADIFWPVKDTRPRFGLLFLHDLEGRMPRDSPAFAQLLDAADVACVCPFGDQSWWTDRVCPEFDPRMTAERFVLESVVPYFAERWGIPERGVALLGVGMGGQGALRLGFKHPKMFPAVAGIASALDYYELYGQGTSLEAMYDSKEQCRQDTALLHLHPTHYPPHIFYCCDPDSLWYRGNDRLHEKMNALGVSHTADFTTPGGPDYFERMAGPALRFVLAGLETESRRLL
jgi:S-formylglutathione hydrolase